MSKVEICSKSHYSIQKSNTGISQISKFNFKIFNPISNSRQFSFMGMPFAEPRTMGYKVGVLHINQTPKHHYIASVRATNNTSANSGT